MRCLRFLTTLTLPFLVASHPSAAVQGTSGDGLVPGDVQYSDKSIEDMRIPTKYPSFTNLTSEDELSPGTDMDAYYQAQADAYIKARAGRVRCETSSASPRVNEANGVYDLLMGKKAINCRQINMWGSRCYKIASYKGGQASLCGGLYELPCGTCAKLVSEILKSCRVGDHVGGMWDWEQGDYLALY